MDSPGASMKHFMERLTVDLKHQGLENLQNQQYKLPPWSGIPDIISFSVFAPKFLHHISHGRADEGGGRILPQENYGLGQNPNLVFLWLTLSGLGNAFKCFQIIDTESTWKAASPSLFTVQLVLFSASMQHC